MVAPDRQAEDLAYAATADGADNRRGAHVDLSPQQRVRDEVRQHLRQDREAHALQPAGTGGAQAFIRLHVGILDDFEEQLPKRADSMDPYRDDRRNRTDRQDRGEKTGDYDLREGAHDFHDAPHDPARHACTDQIGGSEKAEQERAARTENGGDDGDVERDRELVEEIRDVETIGDPHAVACIVVFDRTVGEGRRQVEHGAEDLQRTVRHEALHEVEEIGKALEELARIGAVGEVERGAEDDQEDHD